MDGISPAHIYNTMTTHEFLLLATIVDLDSRTTIWLSHNLEGPGIAEISSNLSGENVRNEGRTSAPYRP